MSTQPRTEVGCNFIHGHSGRESCRTLILLREADRCKEYICEDLRTDVEPVPDQGPLLFIHI
jgi:hypothetical protein